MIKLKYYISYKANTGLLILKSLLNWLVVQLGLQLFTVRYFSDCFVEIFINDIFSFSSETKEIENEKIKDKM